MQILTDQEIQAIRLSKREEQVTQLAVAGLSNADIGARLLVTEDTVKTFMKRAFRKAGVRNRIGLSIWYRETYLPGRDGRKDSDDMNERVEGLSPFVLGTVKSIVTGDIDLTAEVVYQLLADGAVRIPGRPIGEVKDHLVKLETGLGPVMGISSFRLLMSVFRLSGILSVNEAGHYLLLYTNLADARMAAHKRLDKKDAASRTRKLRATQRGARVALREIDAVLAL